MIPLIPLLSLSIPIALSFTWQYFLAGLAFCIIILLLRLIAVTHKVSRQMEHKEATEAKLEVYSRIDHDLRTPLTMITAPLENLKQNPGGQSISDDVHKISQGARLLQDRIDQILELRSVQIGDATLHTAYGDIARFVIEVAKLYSVISPEISDRLHINCEAGPLLTSFDPEKMRRILNILLNQTFRQAGKAGEIYLDVAQTDSNAEIRITRKPEPGKEISLRNYTHTARLANKEAQIEMGIVNEYIRLHDGSITTGGDAASGLFFSFEIPLRGKSPAVQKDIRRSDADENAAETPVILNVEDNPDFRSFITTCLSDRYSVVEAENGKEALDLIFKKHFDLVLSDVVMPVMDGRELCKAIRSDLRFSKIPVILLSAVPGKECELENIKAGADDCLEKPFDIETLRVKIERILQRRPEDAKDDKRPGQKMMSRLDRELLARIDAEIEDNLVNSEYTIEELCSSLNISRSGLYKKLMALTGSSPLEYIRIKRIQKGRAMLESGETSVSQIAWSVGFSPKQFSKYFKDSYGCLPSEYIHHLLK